MVAGYVEPPVRSTPGSVVKASTTWGSRNPTHAVASPMQPSLVSGLQAPVSDMPSGARSCLPDLSELHALPWTLSLRVEHPPTSGQLLPAPVTAMVQTRTTVTITLTVAIPTAQAESVYMPYHLGQLWLAQHEELQSIGIPWAQRSSIQLRFFRRRGLVAVASALVSQTTGSPMRLMAMLAPAHVSSCPFVAASVPVF